MYNTDDADVSISAGAGKYDDDDYDDLYSNVNVSKNFLNYLHQQNPPVTVTDKENESQADVHNPEEAPVDIVNEEPIKKPDRDDEDKKPENPVQVVDVALMISTNLENPPVGNGGRRATVYVGDLHWWTTDADLETELVKYGPVKEIRFFDAKVSGKSKGYANVEFFDEKAATSCKDGMNGFSFKGRPCVVKKLSDSQQVNNMGVLPVRKNNFAPVSSYQGDTFNNNNNNNTSSSYNNSGGFANRGFGSGNWGRGGNSQRVGNRGGGIRNRPMLGGGGGVMGSGYSPGLAMMQQPHYGAPYGGFPGDPVRLYAGMIPSFPPMPGVGLPGVSPHINPAFFGRGMGMGMVSSSGVEGGGMGIWGDQNMGGWGGEENDLRVVESYYAEEQDSGIHYGEVSREKGIVGRLNVNEEKERGLERYRDDREVEYEREIPREKEGSHDEERQEQRQRGEREVDRTRERSCSRDRESKDCRRGERDRYTHSDRSMDRESEDCDDEGERGRSSRVHGKSRLSQGERHKSRDDADYSKRQRQGSE